MRRYERASDQEIDDRIHDLAGQMAARNLSRVAVRLLADEAVHWLNDTTDFDPLDDSSRAWPVAAVAFLDISKSYPGGLCQWVDDGDHGREFKGAAVDHMAAYVSARTVTRG